MPELDGIIDKTPLKCIKRPFRFIKKAFRKTIDFMIENPHAGTVIATSLTSAALYNVLKIEESFSGEVGEAVKLTAASIPIQIIYYWPLFKNWKIVKGYGLRFDTLPSEIISLSRNWFTTFKRAYNWILENSFIFALTTVGFESYRMFTKYANNPESVDMLARSRGYSESDILLHYGFRAAVGFGFYMLFQKIMCFLFHTQNINPNIDRFVLWYKKNVKKDYADALQWLDRKGSYYKRVHFSFSTIKLYAHLNKWDDLLVSLKDAIRSGVLEGEFIPQGFRIFHYRRIAADGIMAYTKEKSPGNIVAAALIFHLFGRPDLSYEKWLELESTIQSSSGSALVIAEAMELLGKKKAARKRYLKFFDELMSSPSIVKKIKNFGSHNVVYFDVDTIAGTAFAIKENKDVQPLVAQQKLLRLHAKLTNDDVYHTIEVISLQRFRDKYGLLMKYAQGTLLNDLVAEKDIRHRFCAVSYYVAKELALLPQYATKARRKPILETFRERLAGSPLEKHMFIILGAIPYMTADYDNYPDVVSTDPHTEQFLLDEHGITRIDIEDRGLAKPQREIAKLYCRGRTFGTTPSELAMRDQWLDAYFIEPFNNYFGKTVLQPKKFHAEVYMASVISSLSLRLSSFDRPEDQETSSKWDGDNVLIIRHCLDKFSQFMTRDAAYAMERILPVCEELAREPFHNTALQPHESS